MKYRLKDQRVQKFLTDLLGKREVDSIMGRPRIGYTFPASKSKLGRENLIYTRRSGRLSFERAAFLLATKGSGEIPPP